MPLRYDATGCDTSTWGPQEAFLASTCCLIAGVSHVTDASVADRLYNRLSAWEKLRGSFRTLDGVDVPLTKDDVHKWIGLKVNVTDYTPYMFGRHLLANLKGGW